MLDAFHDSASHYCNYNSSFSVASQDQWPSACHATDDGLRFMTLETLQSTVNLGLNPTRQLFSMTRMRSSFADTA